MTVVCLYPKVVCKSCQLQTIYDTTGRRSLAWLKSFPIKEEHGYHQQILFRRYIPWRFSLRLLLKNITALVAREQVKLNQPSEEAEP